MSHTHQMHTKIRYTPHTHHSLYPPTHLDVWEQSSEVRLQVVVAHSTHSLTQSLTHPPTHAPTPSLNSLNSLTVLTHSTHSFYSVSRKPCQVFFFVTGFTVSTKIYLARFTKKNSWHGLRLTHSWAEWVSRHKHGLVLMRIVTYWKI